jgi:hypothetical protein
VSKEYSDRVKKRDMSKERKWRNSKKGALEKIKRRMSIEVTKKIDQRWEN